MISETIKCGTNLEYKSSKQGLLEPNSLFDYISYTSPENLYDSERERSFAEYYLPKVLGSSWASYVMTQVGFDALVPGSENLQYYREQRADFVIFKNGNKIVVELDGPEHARNKAYDIKLRTPSGFWRNVKLWCN